MKNNFSIRTVLRLVSFLAAVVAWAGCMPKAQQENVVVEFALPSVARSSSQNLINPLAVCNLNTSIVGAYNSGTNEASFANVDTTADPALFAGILSGQNILTFSGSPELNITSGSDWNFYYFGSFGLSSCSAGDTILSYGQVLNQDIQSDTTISLPVISASGYVQQGGATPPTDFANATFQWRSTGATACSSTGTIHFTLPSALGKTVTTAGVPYSITGTVGSIDMVIGPLPKNLNYSAEVRQTSPSTATYNFDFNTMAEVGATSLNVSVPASASGICQVAASAAPAAPSGLAATPISTSQINLSWTDNATDETGYKIERSPNNSTWTLINTTAANATSYNNTGLTSSTLYYYRVRATNGSGDSAFTPTASATTLALTTPAVPSGLSASPLSSTSIRLLWTDNSADESNFDIERSADNITFSPLASTAANVATYDNTGLTSSTTYWYRVKARNGAGSSVFTASVSATTNASSVPTAPTTLVVTPGAGQTSLMWNDNSSDETDFEIERSATSGSGYAQIGTAGGPNVSVYTDFSPISGNNWYRVRAVNGGTPSTYSNEFMVNMP